MKRKRVVILAGGTGGHIFPALAVARVLREQGFDLQWLGSRVGMEGELVGEEFPMTFVSIKAIRGKSFFSKCLAPLRLSLATWQAWCFIRRSKPDVVLGMGGFVSGPGGIAALFAKVPLVIHEQNAIAGMTNSFLSRRADVVLQGFPEAFPVNIGARTVGNPVRPMISAIQPPKHRFQEREGPLRLLILGGSRGARAINETVIHLLSDYPEPHTVTVHHQAGKQGLAEVDAAYRRLSVNAVVEAFIKDMAQAYAWADVVICRAGALTISELAIVGVASILIPFPYAVDDHQYYNAKYLSDSGAAELIRQRDLSDGRFRDCIRQLAQNSSRRLQMATSARKLAKPDALSAIVTICQKLANREFG